MSESGRQIFMGPFNFIRSSNTIIQIRSFPTGIKQLSFHPYLSPCFQRVLRENPDCSVFFIGSSEYRFYMDYSSESLSFFVSRVDVKAHHHLSE